MPYFRAGRFAGRRSDRLLQFGHVTEGVMQVQHQVVLRLFDLVGVLLCHTFP